MKDWTGILRLEAEERDSRTVARNVYFQGAFKVMRPIYHDDSGQPCYYLLNPGGGYLDGDRYHLGISLLENARLTLTTQSATKIYKTPNTPAYQETEISLKKGSYLEYIPDPLIGYEHARYDQKTVIRMEKGASLLYCDSVTPGWSPEGTLFSYDTLRLRTEIYMDGELAVYDHIKLQPAGQPVNGLGFLEGYTHLGSMLFIGEEADAGLLDELYSAVHPEPDGVRIGMSLLNVPGLVVRILAHSTQAVERIQAECHHLVSRRLFGRNPSFLRKY
ncbi:urease accessory protein UreD [Paenibacillus favisporus]|uniref:urease accessory protein UreD n=1 Tax=Paenibacillus favisporus TaxID=221028 RepID=UPI0013D6AA32|nr:urease accessory protein UreD [Paenibacillus favisporus]